MQAVYKHFMGEDGFVWFTGVVEDRNDPDALGRVRVRCLGYHTEDLNDMRIPSLNRLHELFEVHMEHLGEYILENKMEKATHELLWNKLQSINLLVHYNEKLDQNLKSDVIWKIGDKSNNDQLKAVTGICFMFGVLFLIGLFANLNIY